MADFVYFHHLDPFAIKFWGQFGIRWYGLSYIAGFFVGYLFLLYLLKKKKTTLSKEEISSLVNYGIFGVLIGGRIGYCLFYQPHLWLQWSSQFPFWGVLEIHKGGMASHGGMIGLFLAMVIFAKKNQQSVLHIVDMIVFGGGIGMFFGRIANFINGELYGRIIEKSAWFGVQFPKEIYQWYVDQNIQKLLSLEKVLPYIGDVKSPFGSETLPLSSWTHWVTNKNPFTAEVSSILNRIYTLVESGNEKVIQALSEVLPIRHPSQLYQAVLEGLIPFLIVFSLWILKPVKKGLIAGVWAFTYLVMRIVGEQFRMPDSHIGFDLLGLTRGQWMSIGCLVPVSIYLYWILFKNSRSDQSSINH